MITKASRGSRGVAEMRTGSAKFDEHFSEFSSLVSIAERYESLQQWNAACAYAKMASQYAWFNHTGYFASPKVEALLCRIGARLSRPQAVSTSASCTQTILHVVTQVYDTSGPTQAIVCWMEQDKARRHIVCITGQGPLLLPKKVLSQLKKRTDLICLDKRPGGVLSRAAWLRSLAESADIVLLHTHPDDVVPVLAFSAKSRTPVVYVNHADHVFWIGASVASLVLNMRDSGHNLTVQRRGVSVERSMVMSRPLRVLNRIFSREEAKLRLGIDPSRVLLVTAAGASKFNALARPNFFDLVHPVVAEHRKVLLLAAGPPAEGEWAERGRKVGDRIRALGRLPDVSLLHQAADIYVDSYPFASLTSLIEAGSFGTPVVTFRGHPEEGAVLGSDTRGLDEHMIKPRNMGAFSSALDNLIMNPSERHHIGTKLREAILTTHKGSGWLSSANELYHSAREMRFPGPQMDVPRATGYLDQYVEFLMAENPYNPGLGGVVRDNLGWLPFGERIKVWFTLSLTEKWSSFRQLFPVWIISQVGPLWKRVRAVGQFSRKMPSNSKCSQEENR
jgi:glycosyltransferase involved in cell wall biosynthesis